MPLFRKIIVIAALVAGGIVAAGATSGAGISEVSVSGVAVCDTATGVYHLSWTIAKTNNPSSPTSITSGTQTPPSADLVVPTVIPADPGGQGVLQSVVATSTLPGTTSGTVTFEVVIIGTPPSQASVTLDGTCAVVVAVEASPNSLTG